MKLIAKQFHEHTWDEPPKTLIGGGDISLTIRNDHSSMHAHRFAWIPRRLHRDHWKLKKRLNREDR
jgi:hypothetical protein